MHFKLLIGILTPFLLGVFGISAILREKLSFFAYLERLAIAFAAGAWMLVLIMFCLPSINITLTPQNIYSVSFIILLGLAPFSLKSLKWFLPKTLPSKKCLWFYIILTLIIIKVFFVFWSALIQPALDPDIVKCYAIVAKHVFIFKSPRSLAQKPPFPFMIESWPPISIGIWNDTLLPLFYPFMYISLLLIFFSSLKRYYSDLSSLFFSFILASIPFLLFHAGTAYTDFPQAFYYSVATFYLFQFAKEFKSSKTKAHSFLLASMVFLGISVWVKKSGLYYAGINLSVLVLFLAIQWKSIQKKEWLTFIFAIMLFAGIVSPWLAHDKIRFINSYSKQVVTSTKFISSGKNKSVIDPQEQAHLKLLAPNRIIAHAALRNMFMQGNWQLLWIFFSAIFILFPKKCFSFPNITLLLIVLFNLTALFVLFRFTMISRYIYNDSLFNRLMLHFVPVVFYFCAETLLSSD